MKKYFTADMLKIIGMSSILCDHCAIVFAGYGLPVWAYWTMRCVGRLAFPIFTYFIVQGFIYTHSVGKYGLRILLAAVLSEIPYNMAIFGKVWYFGHNNVLFTFAMALFVLWLAQKIYKKNTHYVPFVVIPVLWAMAVSYVLGLDYSWRCILLAVIFYYLRSYRSIMYTAGGIVMIISGSVAGLATPLALIPIHLHDGEKGRIPRFITYAFYPAHLLLLSIIRIIM